MSTTPPAPSSPATGLRALFTMRAAPGRFPFALRAGFCMGVPILVGVLAGDTAAGLMATIGAFTSLYGSGRPYVYRAVMLALIAIGFALAVGLGLVAAASPPAAIVVVALIAMAATLLCRALDTGPPGAYLFALSCAAGTAMGAVHLTPLHAAMLVLAGGGFSWLTHMAGALAAPRRPEKAAVVRAAQAVEAFIAATGTPRQDAARHNAALVLHDAWSALVTYQPLNRHAEGTVGRLRGLNRELHLLYADAMSHAARGERTPAVALEEVRRIGRLASDPRTIVPAQHDEIPLGRLNARDALEEALKPGSMSLLVVTRVGLASLIAGLVGDLMGLQRGYWSVAAAVLMLHFGLDWRRTVQRGLERMAGTWAGLALAAIVVAWHPEGLWLVAVVAILQFTIEMLVLRNYAFAVVFITAIALVIATGGRDVPGHLDLLLARGVDTTLGCLIGIASFALLEPRAALHRLRADLAASLDAIARMLPYLARNEVASHAARLQRRRVQHRVFALGETFDAGVGGMRQQRREAEQMWPAVAAAQRLAYRLLAECWAVERAQRDGRAREPSIAAHEAIELEAAIVQVADTVREGHKPPAIEPAASLLREELRQLQAALSREPG
jgi:uncharacterized membrane protein YccC